MAELSPQGTEQGVGRPDASAEAREPDRPDKEAADQGPPVDVRAPSKLQERREHREEVAEDMFKQVGGVPGRRVKRHDPIFGQGNRVVLEGYDKKHGRSLVLKLTSRPDPKAAGEAEVAAAKAADSIGVPTELPVHPELIISDDGQYGATLWGKLPSDCDSGDASPRWLGEQLKKLHTQAEVPSEVPAWDVGSRYAGRLARLEGIKGADLGLVSVLKPLIEQAQVLAKDVLSTPRRVLCHGDPRKENTVGLWMIDWESAVSAPPEVDIGIAWTHFEEAGHGQEAFDDFIEGYGDTDGIDPALVLDVVRIKQISHILWCADRSDQPQYDAQGWARYKALDEGRPYVHGVEAA
jgi:hypothetical protein